MQWVLSRSKHTQDLHRGHLHTTPLSHHHSRQLLTTPLSNLHSRQLLTTPLSHHHRGHLHTTTLSNHHRGQLHTPLLSKLVSVGVISADVQGLVRCQCMSTLNTDHLLVHAGQVRPLCPHQPLLAQVVLAGE